MAKRIVGGLLSGLGEGMLEAARAKRQQALFALQQQAIADREVARDERRGLLFQREQQAITTREAQRERRADKRAEQAHERQSSLLSNIVTGEDNELIGITRGGETKRLGVKDRLKLKSGLSVEDKRELDAAIDRHTTGQGSLDGKRTNWDSVAQQLRRVGREDLAARVETEGIDVDSERYKEAKRLADDWVSARAGLFRSDKKDFAEYGGSRTEARQAKTLQFYRELTDEQSSPESGNRQPLTDGPPGSGTRVNLYRATTQSHVDWFHESAPAGSVIEVEGKLYEK